MNLEQLTIIVPTRNEAGNIARFLASIPSALSLIVVDSSDDATPELVEHLRPSAQVIRVRANIPVARQLGAELAQTPWLLYTANLTVHSFDHRRLEMGLARKVFHGAVRNVALYFGLFDRRVRSGDWGYWADSAAKGHPTGAGIRP